MEPVSRRIRLESFQREMFQTHLEMLERGGKHRTPVSRAWHCCVVRWRKMRWKGTAALDCGWLCAPNVTSLAHLFI
jgi:hypothetical protein